MSRITRQIDQALYPSFDDNWDDSLFRSRIAECISADSVVLDIGAGAGLVKQMNFKGYVAKICGIDLDERVVHNPMLDQGNVADAASIPYPDSYFDVVFADNVCEHLDDPAAVLTEIYRVLKPNGVFLFKTPNRWHYMPLIARCTPHWFHQYINRVRGRAAADTFPTRYRINTLHDVQRLAQAAGFSSERIERVEGRPEYLRMMWPTYLIGAAYERLVNLSPMFEIFRVLLVAKLRKPNAG